MNSDINTCFPCLTETILIPHDVDDLRYFLQSNLALQTAFDSSDTSILDIVEKVRMVICDDRLWHIVYTIITLLGWDNYAKETSENKLSIIIQIASMVYELYKLLNKK